MNAPFHCGKQAKPYAKVYLNRKKQPHSIEHGFKCSVCGQARLPYGEIEPNFMAQMDAIREEGIKFDESLTRV